MTFLSPADICCLGATSRYWRAMVRDPVLWKYFLLRDMPHWPSIDHVSMPQLDAPLISEDESLDDREEGDNKGMELKFDYMSEWVFFFFWKAGYLKYEFLGFIYLFIVVTDTWKAARPASSSIFPRGQRMRSWPHFFSLWCPLLSHVTPCLALEWSSWTSL